MDYRPWDVVVIPFPFVDSSKSKLRPVLMLSKEHFMQESGHAVAAMITSATHHKWPGDTPITDIDLAGLKKASIIRLKLFTLDLRFTPRTIGTLSETDQAVFQKQWMQCMV